MIDSYILYYIIFTRFLSKKKSYLTNWEIRASSSGTLNGVWAERNKQFHPTHINECPEEIFTMVTGKRGRWITMETICVLSVCTSTTLLSLPRAWPTVPDLNITHIKYFRTVRIEMSKINYYLKIIMKIYTIFRWDMNS